MGRGSREKPTKLGKKLARIRTYLGVSQDGLVRALGLSAKLTRNDICKYERGVREPALPVLLQYARAVKINVEVLIDDDLELPRIFHPPESGNKRATKGIRKRKV
ncbi:MAG: Helix-turn-helix domain [Blastocatellia bacterium]|jgi:transcriptional regulator with XRE-family HTH domain|nr:Helix-turn-helix domain [Blastocatellia bacterium]